MFSELSKVLDNGILTGSFERALEENAANKSTKSNQHKTNGFLKNLYQFDANDVSFAALLYFWKVSDIHSKPLLALVYATQMDYLLRESIQVVAKTAVGEKVLIEKLEENIEDYHPKRFSDNTKRSVAQNIASSWKQAGFIEGKVKNIRVQPEINYHLLTFALLLGYLDNQRGDYLFSSPPIKALHLPDSKVRELAIEASKRDLLRYQSSGTVTTINFETLLKTIGIHGI